MTGQFDRLPAPAVNGVPRKVMDPEGKRALFSPDAPPDRAPLFGTVTVACSACEEVTVLTARQAVLIALPSLHLPLVKRNYPSWMRCPACGRRTWVRLTVRW